MSAPADAAAPAVLGVVATLWGTPVSGLEVIGFVLALAMVLLNMRVHPMAWPLAMASSAAYALLFAQSRLYGQVGLQIVFIVLAGWGWAQWLRGRGGDGKPLVVHRLTARGRLLALGAALPAWPLLGLVLDHASDSALPYLDALPVVASVAGQVLLGRKLIESWPVWLMVNLVSIGLFAASGLWLTVVLYALFAVLSVVGWRAWRRLEGRVAA